MTSEKTLPQAREQRPDHELDRRYGAIGISAVAAAVRFQGSTRQEPQQPLDDDRGTQRKGGAA